MDKIDTNKVRRAAKAMINTGTSKQKVYEELVKEFRFRNAVADVVRYIPSYELKKKYDFLNIICLVVLSIVAVLKIIAHSFGGIIWIGFMIYAVADRQYKYYYWLIILGVLSLGSSMLIYFTKESHTQLSLIVLCIDGGVSLFFLVSGILLPQLMTPPYEERKQAYVNAAGQKKLMVVHIFKSEEKSTGTLDEVF